MLNRDQIQARVLQIMREKFEICEPGLDDDLREKHNFDSIDGIELLEEIEDILGFELTQDQKKRALEIRTIAQIVRYADALQCDRCANNTADEDG